MPQSIVSYSHIPVVHDDITVLFSLCRSSVREGYEVREGDKQHSREMFAKSNNVVWLAVPLAVTCSAICIPLFTYLKPASFDSTGLSSVDYFVCVSLFALSAVIETVGEPFYAFFARKADIAVCKIATRFDG